MSTHGLSVQHMLCSIWTEHSPRWGRAMCGGERWCWTGGICCCVRRAGKQK